MMTCELCKEAKHHWVYVCEECLVKLPKTLIVEWLPEVGKYRIHTTFEFGGQRND